MPLEDKILRHTVQREITRIAQSIDTDLMTIMVINGVVYLGGRIRPLRGAMGRGVDVKLTVAKLEETIKSLRGVSEVVVDAAIEERP